MKSLNTEYLYKALTLHLLTQNEVIQWADKQIEKLEKPPYWLIEISASENLSHYDFEKIVLESTSDFVLTDNEFLGAIAYRYIKKQESLVNLWRECYERFCSIEWTEMTDVRQQIYNIDDELDWNKKQAAQTALTFLTPYLCFGKELIEKANS